MSLYLHDIPLPEAQYAFEIALKSAGLWGMLGTEQISIDQHAAGRILAEPIWARISSPHYHASAMDGFAVHSEDTIGAMSSAPILLQVGKQAIYVDTGDPLPEDFDAVIPIENIEAMDQEGFTAKDIRKPDRFNIRSAVTPWSHVRPLGEDVVTSQLVLPAGHVIRPVDMGAIAASGWDQIVVAKRPRVTILPTGSELVMIGSHLKPGDILEYNSIVLAAQVKEWGGQATCYPPTKDILEELCERVQEAANCSDLVLINAGSSAGSEDYSSAVIEKLGQILVHGVAIRPGHPVILGMVARTKNDTHGEGIGTMIPIIGVPGYPVSAALTGEIFVEPLLAMWTGRKSSAPQVVKARLTRKITSSAGDDDYIRVVLGRVGKSLLAAPLPRGAGIITSLVHADGILILPRGVQGVAAGEDVEIKLYRSLSEVERTIFCIGSHDLSLDILSVFLAQHDRRLASSNVGSLGGIIAIQRGEAHIAGTHLLDPETGEYNLSYIKEYLAAIPVMLVTLVNREQGLIVKRGNPKAIRGLVDLAREKSSGQVRFINRQRGAGTRILLDHNLKLLGMIPNEINGYNQEEFTHFGVAAAISSGRADCGLGIAAAAHALDLDFLPLFQERYDLIIPSEFASDRLLRPLFDILASTGFKDAVKQMPGYNVSEMGRKILEG